MSEWLPHLLQALQQHGSAVRILVADVRGSAPREPGASMIITHTSEAGTIGGGRLEWEALRAARQLLANGSEPATLDKFVLGAQLGQCCGGVVELWLERYSRTDLPLLTEAWQRSRAGALELRSTLLEGREVQRVLSVPARPWLTSTARAQLQRQGNAWTLVELLDRPPALWLYGAGHVGRAVVSIAAELPWLVCWIDSRRIERHCANVHALHADEPVATVAQAPPDTCFLVMTHSHALDYALCRAILARPDAAWVGLIGSHSKSARFRAQLRRDGVPAADVERLVCPIGIGIGSKHPTAIAVSVVAQLLQHLQPAEPRASVAAACAQTCSSCGSPAVSS